MADLIVPDSMQTSYDNFKFAPAQQHNGILYCSGQLGTAQDGKIPDDVEEEFRNAWTAVGVILEAAGMDFTNIVEFTTYHVGLQANLGAFMKIKDEFIQEPYPA
ncbi:MAG: Rid family hydrolase, partial [Pseudomonadota bacterium]